VKLTVKEVPGHIRVAASFVNKILPW